MKEKAGLLVLGLTLLATLAAGYYAWRHWLLVHDSATTTALSLQVDRKRRTGKNLTGVPYRYVATYTFADESGTVRNGRQTIDGSRYHELAARAPDAPVAVYYSRSNPDISSLDRNASRNVAIVLALIALVGWGIVVSRRMST